MKTKSKVSEAATKYLDEHEELRQLMQYGTDTTRITLSNLAIVATTGNESGRRALAVFQGGLIAAALGMRAMTQPDSLPDLEKMTLALVRGIMRNHEGPLNEDGSSFVGLEGHYGNA